MTKLRYVNQIDVSFFNRAQFMNMLEKTIEAETELEIM